MRKLDEINYDMLGDEDLLKLIIMEKSGTFSSQKLLKEKDLKDLIFDTTPEEIASIGGIGKARAEQLLAIQEMVKRLLNAEANVVKRIKTPQDAYDLIRPDIIGLKKEVFIVIILNTKGEVISKKVISVGTLNSSLVHPREVLRPAIKHSGNTIIIAHNHPSQDTAPSNEDLLITKRLSEAATLIGITLVDHIIATDSKYLSFKEENLI